MGAPSRPLSEMLSGPDLGGGYLHQLSLERIEGATTFTHHAQEGGQDAAGPPVGGLDVLGFVQTPSPCMFGGPRCWHRRYLLPPSSAAKVRFAYQRHRFLLETMLRQAHGLAPVPFEEALGELLQKVAVPLAAEGIEWYIGGSASVRLAGGSVTPQGITLGTTRPGVDRLGALLADYLVEPVAPTDWPGGRLVVGARAFVGTPRKGARVGWSVPLEGREPLRWEEFVGVPGVVRTLELPVLGQTVRISRPEYALVRSASQGLGPDTEAALAVVAHLGPDRELLEVLLQRSEVPDQEQEALRARLAD